MIGQFAGLNCMYHITDDNAFENADGADAKKSEDKLHQQTKKDNFVHVSVIHFVCKKRIHNSNCTG